MHGSTHAPTSVRVRTNAFSFAATVKIFGLEKRGIIAVFILRFEAFEVVFSIVVCLV